MGKSLSTIARMEFAARLQQSLDKIGFGRSPTRLAEAFNGRSAADAVSTHGARKWLTGESIPIQSRIVVLASWLRVDVAWLRFGDSALAPSEMAVCGSELEILRSELGRLSEPELKVVRSVMDVIFKMRELSV